MNCTNSSVRAKPPIAPPTRSFLVLLTDNSRLRVTCADLAKQLRQERTGTLKRLRQARKEMIAARGDAISDAKAYRALDAELRGLDRQIGGFSKQICVRPDRKSRVSATNGRRSRFRSYSHSDFTPPRAVNSGLARRDRLGREGLMLTISYVRAGGKHAAPGCIRRHWYYITRESAVTRDEEGKPIILSSFGDDAEDVAEGLDLQEKLLRAMRSNSKLGSRMVGAFPYGFPVDARREVLRRLGQEIFDPRGMPWSAAAHDADPDSEVDNPHFHFDYGALPMERKPDGSYIVTNDLRTDLDGRDGLRFLRHSVARVLTDVAQEYGLNREFTALSYRERGMDREAGEHVGQAGTAAHRRGEYVAAIARNELKKREADARERERKARSRLAALERLKREVEGASQAPHLMAGMPEAKLNAPAMPTLASDVADAIARQEDLGSYHLPSPPLIHDVTKVTSIKDPPAIHYMSLEEVASLADAQETERALPILTRLGPPPPTITSPPTVHALVDASSDIAGQVPPQLIDIDTFAFDAASASSEAIEDEAFMEFPPVITSIGAAVRYSDVVEPRLWSLGKLVPTNAADEDFERHLEDLTKRIADAKAREAENANHRQRRIADAAAFEALERYDEWIGEAEGRYTVSDAALHAGGLSRARLDTPEAQKALKAIAMRQTDRLDPVLDDLSGGMPLYVEGGVLRLHQRFPEQLRNDFVRWSEHPQFRSLITRIWPSTGKLPGHQPNSLVEPPANPARERDRALTALFNAIVAERHFLPKERGVPMVDPALIARFGLVADDLAGDDVRKRIAKVAENQNAEVSLIASIVQRSPHQIVRNGDGWLLNNEAPVEHRTLVAAWRNDPTIQRALGMVASRRPVADAVRDDAGSVAEGAGVAWRSARKFRLQAMARNGAIERLYGSGLPQAGRRLTRPGFSETVDTPTNPQRFMMRSRPDIER